MESGRQNEKETKEEIQTERRRACVKKGSKKHTTGKAQQREEELVCRVREEKRERKGEERERE